MKKFYLLATIAIGLLSAPLAAFWYAGRVAEGESFAWSTTLIAATLYLTLLPFLAYRFALTHGIGFRPLVARSTLTLAHVGLLSLLLAREVATAVTFSSFYVAALWLPVLAVWLVQRFFAEFSNFSLKNAMLQSAN